MLYCSNVDVALLCELIKLACEANKAPRELHKCGAFRDTRLPRFLVQDTDRGMEALEYEEEVQRAK